MYEIIIGIGIIILSILIAILPTYKNKNLVFIIPIIGIILGAFQIIDWNKKNELEDMIKTKLETSIDWKNSEFELKFLSDEFNEKILNKFIISLKVYSKEALKKDVSWKDILSKTYIDDVNFATQLVIKLKTTAGEKRLFFSPVPIDAKNNSIKFVDYIGIYVPKFF